MTIEALCIVLVQFMAMGLNSHNCLILYHTTCCIGLIIDTNGLTAILKPLFLAEFISIRLRLSKEKMIEAQQEIAKLKKYIAEMK